MLKNLFTIFVLVGLFINCQSIIADGARVERLSADFSFTEGPAADRQGNVYFTDQPNNRILKWSSIDGSISVLTDNSGRANGLYVANNGSLLSCSDMDNELWSIDLETGEHTVLVSNFGGRRLNGPNDLFEHPSGGIYFTDPLYPRDYWTRDPETEQPYEGVYYLPPANQTTSVPPTLVRLIDDLVKPNGIIGTPDGAYLYIADIGDDKTYRYTVQPDGTLGNRTLFASMGSDGMTIDNRGNIYLVGDGVTVFNSAGEQIEKIPIVADWTANICFGGRDMQTLFITASEYLYSVRTRVRGVRWD